MITITDVYEMMENLEVEELKVLNEGALNFIEEAFVPHFISGVTGEIIPVKITNSEELNSLIRMPLFFYPTKLRLEEILSEYQR